MGKVTRTVNGRIPRQVGAEHYQTYKMIQPSDQKIVVACEQAGCPYWTTGWDTIIDENTDLGATQAAYFRSGMSGRTFRELGKTGEGLTVFRFEAHQRCFEEHETVPEIFAVVGGDFRGNPRGTPARVHSRPDDWVEDFALNQAAIIDRINRG